MTPEFHRGFHEELEKISFSVSEALNLARRGKRVTRKLPRRFSNMPLVEQPATAEELLGGLGMYVPVPEKHLVPRAAAVEKALNSVGIPMEGSEEAAKAVTEMLAGFADKPVVSVRGKGIPRKLYEVHAGRKPPKLGPEASKKHQGMLATHEAIGERKASTSKHVYPLFSVLTGHLSPEPVLQEVTHLARAGEQAPALRNWWVPLRRRLGSFMPSEAELFEKATGGRLQYGGDTRLSRHAKKRLMPLMEEEARNALKQMV